MATYLSELVNKLNTVFGTGHPASAADTKAANQTYTNPVTGSNTVIKPGSIFSQGLDQI